MIALIIISISTIFFIFLDYHRKDNIHQALIFIGLFLVGTFILSILIDMLALMAALVLPALIIGVLLFKLRK